MNGLTFNGKHSFNDMGLVMFSKNRPILPEPKIVTEDIQNMDGEYDYSSVSGRVRYKPVTDEIEFFFAEKNMSNVRAKAHQIAAWLASGEAQLIYDDDPTIYYLAMVVNKLDLENQIIRARKVTVQFKRRPFGYGLTEESHSYTTAGSKTINNPGTFVMPKFTVTGSFTTLTLSCNGKTLTYSEAIEGASIVIDNMQCIKDGNTNKNNVLSGEFFEFANGNNSLIIGGTGLDCTVTVSFRPQYL